MRNHTIRPQLDQVFPPLPQPITESHLSKKNDYICAQGQAITDLPTFYQER